MKPTADRAAGPISTVTGVRGRTSVRNLMLPYAATSRWAAPVFAPMSVIGPMRTLVFRQAPNPTKVLAVGTQLSAQDSRTTARRLGGVLRESQPLARVPAPAREVGRASCRER